MQKYTIGKERSLGQISKECTMTNWAQILKSKVFETLNPFGTTGTPKSNYSPLSTEGCEENYFWIIVIYIIPKF